MIDKYSVNHVVINYRDSDYMNYIYNTASLYCKRTNDLFNYWKQVDINKCQLVKEKFLLNETFIKKIFINKIIGEYINNYEFNNIIDIEDFINIKNNVIKLFSDIYFLTDEELKIKLNIIKNDSCSKYLIISYNDNKFNFKIL